MTYQQGSEKPRVLYFVANPIHNQAPMLKYLATEASIDLHVVFEHKDGLDSYYDEFFKREVAWDIPLTDGFSHEFLHPAGKSPSLLKRGTDQARHLASLVRAFRAFKPDVVWAHGYDSRHALVLLAACKMARIPLLVRADVEESDAQGGPKVRAVKDVLLRWYYPLIDGFLAVGKRNAKFYSDRGVPARKIFMTPYGIDNDRFSHGSGAQQASKNPVTFLFTGKLIPRKRPQDALEALRRIPVTDGVEPHLVFVGSGELEPKLREMTEVYGLEDRVKFAGFVNQKDIVGYYQRAAALLLISERERWGLVANEAMAAGCPVISYEAVGCSHDLVQDGKTGYVVETRDVDALARAMRNLMDPAQLDTMSQAALEHISHYSFSDVVDGLFESLEALGVLDRLHQRRALSMSRV